MPFVKLEIAIASIRLPRQFLPLFVVAFTTIFITPSGLIADCEYCITLERLSWKR